MATPNDLLKKVKKRFLPLLIENETDLLESQLVKALTQYQDLAGYTTDVRIAKGDSLSIPCPTDYLELVGVKDATGNYISASVFSGVIEINSTQRVTYPLTMSYLVRLSALDLQNGIVPPVAEGIISDYLEVLIAIPNAAIDRKISIAGKLDSSGIPDEVTLTQRKLDLEREMSTRGAIPQAFSVFSSFGAC